MTTSLAPHIMQKLGSSGNENEGNCFNKRSRKHAKNKQRQERAMQQLLGDGGGAAASAPTGGDLVTRTTTTSNIKSNQEEDVAHILDFFAAVLDLVYFLYFLPHVSTWSILRLPYGHIRVVVRSLRRQCTTSYRVPLKVAPHAWYIHIIAKMQP